MPIKRAWWLWGGLLLACAAYFLPWVWTSTAALTPNAYDLAEWTTLHPAVRHVSPPLLPSFLLRAALGVLTVLIVLQSSQTNGRWFGRMLALGGIVIMLPPADFFLFARADINYQQQFYLSGFTLLLVLGAAFGNNRLPILIQKILVLLFAVLGFVAGIWGLTLSMKTLSVFGVDMLIGGGGILFCGILLAFGIDAVASLSKQQKTRGK